MKKILLILGSLIALCVVAVLIVPNFIDWNAYKPQITDQVRKLTGRELVIAGDINFKVLPTPVLIAEKVLLSSIDGAQSPDFVALRSVEVRIALAPLLGANLKIETVRLVEPQISLEVLADGRSSWTLSLPKTPNAEEAAAAGQAGAANAPEASAGPAISLGNFEIVSGSVVYTDAASGTREQINDINLSVAAVSLSTGPYRASGSLVARGLRLGIKADVGTIVGGRTFPLNLDFLIGGDSAKISLAGTVLGLNDAPRFRGTLNVDSANIGRVVGALANGAELPAPLSQALTLSGKLDASQTSLSLDDLQLDFGGAKGTGKIAGDFGGAPKLTATLTIDKVDADPWLVEKAEAPVAAPAKTAAPAQSSAAAAKPATKDAGFALPGGITASLMVKVGEISLKGDKIKNAVLNAELANAELVLNQFSIQGPGGSDLAVFGFLSAKNGKPSFDGQVQAKVQQPRTLMKWAGVDSTALKPGMPASLSLNIEATATPEAVSVRKLVLGVDKTTINGAANIALRDRIGIGASVAVDQLDLDAYLADAGKAPAKTSTPAGQPAPAGTTAPDAATGGMFDALKPLTAFDANLRANIGMLKTAGVPMKDIALEIGLVQGNLTIKKLSVGDALSASVNVSGSLTGLGGTPTAKALAIRSDVRDPAKLAAFQGFELPIPAKTLGPISFATDINGQLTAPSMKTTIKAMAATVNVDGNLQPFDLLNMFDLAVRLRHPDTAGLMNKLGAIYHPAGAIGGLDVATTIKGGINAFKFSGLAAVIGDAKINGEGNVQLAGARPKITTSLSTGTIVVDPFLPAKKAASLDDGQAARMIPARFLVPEGGTVDFKHLIATVAERWSSTPFDMSALTMVDADITVASPRISFHEYNLDGARLLSSLDNGLLKVNEFSGKVFGGAVMSSASVNAAAKQPALAGVFTLGNMDIGAASKAAGIAGTTGTLTSRIDVATTGKSIADWVRALDGKGAIEVKGIKGQTSMNDLPVIGLALGPLMQIFEVLNSGLGSLIGAGGKTKLGETDVTSSFTIANGIINTKDTRILSNIYQGDIAGDINLPLWSMNVGGTVAVDQGLLGAVLANVAKIPSKIPFQVTGDIDKPNVKIQSFSGAGSAGGNGIAVPGLEKLEKKIPGVGNLLQGILGGGSSTQQTAPAPQTGTTPPAQQQPQPQQQQQQQQQQINPADLLKKLFK